MIYNVPMTIQKLLLLESEAKAAMQALEKEQAQLAKKAEEDLQLHMAALESEKNEAIQRLATQTEKDAGTIIAKIQADYKRKGSELIHAFAINHNTWRDKITRDVLNFRL